MTHREPRTYDADHPAVLVGADHGPTPGRVPAPRTRRVPHRRHRQHRRCPRCQPRRGQLDRRGRHRPDGPPRPRPRRPQRLPALKVSVTRVRGDDPDALRRIVEQSRARSAVLRHASPTACRCRSRSTPPELIPIGTGVSGRGMAPAPHRQPRPHHAPRSRHPPTPTMTTWSSSAPAPPAPRPPCSSPAPDCRCCSSTATGPGTDTLSTHALMRGGVVQLHRWGLLDRIVAAGHPADAQHDVPLRRRRSLPWRSSPPPASMRCTPRAARCSTRSSSTLPDASRRHRPLRRRRDRRPPRLATAASSAIDVRDRDGRPATVRARSGHRRRRTPLDDRPRGRRAAHPPRPSTRAPSSTDTGRTSTPTATSGPTGRERPPASSRPTTAKTCVFAGGPPAVVGRGGDGVLDGLIVTALARDGRAPACRHGASLRRDVHRPTRATSAARGDRAGRSSATPGRGRTR